MRSADRQNLEAPTSRRRFLARSGCALAFAAGHLVLQGCDAVGGEAQLPDGVRVEGNTIFVDLERQSGLLQPDGYLWIEAENVIVVHDDVLGFRAFSSVCPHERKDVSRFDGTQLRCPSHDWTFDLEGAPTGRASRGLARYPASEAEGVLQIVR